ncbi:MAG: hypothetical protein NDI61_07775 [Bdellovibrionaceae bacterium]|nr:hypothetical protein [Pseudobdellovibrionaceae bacterium]
MRNGLWELFKTGRTISWMAGGTVLLLANVALAQVPNFWKLSRETTEKVYTLAAFSDLQARFPELLVNVDAAAITFAQVDTKTYTWIGPSACSAGDPRLIVAGRSVSFCQDRGGNGVTVCSASSQWPGLPARDPCASTPSSAP